LNGPRARSEGLNDWNVWNGLIPIGIGSSLPLPDAYSTIEEIVQSRYKDYMKTLTITDAKKNLGRLLAAAARGEDIGIVCGADIVALRKVDIESTDYAQREYGATPNQVAALEKATEQRYRRLKRGKKLTTTTAEELREMLE
jgi:antitoxin (DNA-binding transcriptional repressor) of toxin-antitoxin stability system